MAVSSRSCDDAVTKPDDGVAEPDDGVAESDDGVAEPGGGAAKPGGGVAEPDGGLVNLTAVVVEGQVGNRQGTVMGPCGIRCPGRRLSDS
ncbi:hypothetical protein GCM10009828_091660 [Actinoplanes couchii]|uniref:Uncharacterized protein n=1 Tax=Actinoplanes couchii TaxID=403638 RepID=A0ABQ3XH02_9ACTN|nr:hypothetical protein Aco03nite_061780 [Actinoplanes couchii]